MAIFPGLDASGNGNDWTTNNINNTNSTATTYDIMTDVPTLTDADTSNYATLNPLNPTVPATLSEANLKSTFAALYQYGYSTINIPEGTGKYVFDITFNTTTTNNNYSGGGLMIDYGANGAYVRTLNMGASGAYGVVDSGPNFNQEYIQDGVGSGSITLPPGTNIQFLVDRGANTLQFVKNGVLQTGTGSTVTIPSSGNLVPFTFGYSSNCNANFGQRPFAYTPPTGYKKLNTFNLPDSSIVDGSKHFVPVIWTANGSDQFISTGFDPDFVWYKTRNQAYDHYLLDSLRSGALNSNNTDAEGGGGGSSNLGTGGFTINAGAASDTEVAWNWKAGGTAVLNEAGTIDSQVSANPTAGFSVVTYTGNGTTTTVGHGLGTSPKVVIMKNRDIAQTWHVYTTIVDGTLDYLNLNTGAPKVDSGLSLPTSSVFSIGSSTSGLANDYVAYCFSDVEGYSKFGSYTGNGSADGVFNYTGFRPAYIMVKVAIGFTNNWHIFDSATTTYNPDDTYLLANGSGAEVTANAIDFLSNGFKLRNTSQAMNNASGTYIYMAFAENPFKNSLAR